MAYLATNIFDGDGVTTDWDFSFAGVAPDSGSGTLPYLYPADVKALELYRDVDGNAQAATRNVTLVAPNRARIEGAPVIVGRRIKIYRSTEIRFPLVDYRDRQTVSDLDLDLANRQSIFIAQETQDAASNNMALDKNENYDVLDRRLVNLADGIDPTDAVNLRQLQHSIRVPESEPTISALPDPATRAGKLLSFDAAGVPVVRLPAEGSATDLEYRLSLPTGSDLVGHNTFTVGGTLDGLIGSTQDAPVLPQLTYVPGNPLSVPSAAHRVTRLGVAYKAKVPAVFPVALTGTWATDAGLLVDAGYEQLRQELASTAPGAGAEIIGRGTVYVGSYADIRALKKTSAAKVANFDGFIYKLDETDTTSAASLPRIVVAADGGRWKSTWKRGYDVLQYCETPTSNISEAINRAFAVGGAITVPDGVYNLSDTVVSSYADPAFPEVGAPSIRVSMLGESSANTIFINATSDTIKVAFKLEGTALGTGGQGIHGQDKFGRFSMNRVGNPYPTGQEGVGIWVLNKAMTSIEDVQIQFMGTGIELDGCLSSTFTNLRMLNGNRGVVINASPLSMPNALTFNSLLAAGNNIQGVLCNQLGAGNVFIGGSIENNGTHLQAANGGFVANLVGTNGTACLTMIGVYFEGNGGQADVFLDNVTGYNISVNFINCTFNRVSHLRYVGSNLDLRSSGGGKLKVNLSSCSFLETGSYVPSGTRPYVFTDGNVEVNGWDTCTYSHAVSIPSFMHSSASAVISGGVSKEGILSSGLRTVSVTRVAAGIYNLDKADEWAPVIGGYDVSITPYGPEARIESVTRQSTTRVQVVFRSHAAAENVDCAFSFMIARSK